MALELITPPAEEPLTLADAKAYLRIGDTSEDVWINAAIRAVRGRLEAYCRRTLITQTWRWWLDAFPEPVRVLEVPRPPLIAVTHLKTYDPTDTAAVFDADQYLVDVVSHPGRLVLRSGKHWPEGLRPVQGIEIEFTAGYGAAVDVPPALVEGIRLWLRLLYANRSWLFDSGTEHAGLLEFNRETIPTPVRILWDPYRMERL